MTSKTITLYIGQSGMCTVPALRCDVQTKMRDILKDKTYFCIVSVNLFLHTNAPFLPLYVSALLYKRIDVRNKPDLLPRFKTASVGNLLKSLISDELIKAYTVTPIGHTWSHKIFSPYYV